MDMGGSVVIAATLFLMAGFCEIWLLRTNWLARQKLGMYEMNKLWRWFDKRGRGDASLGIHFALMLGLLSLGLFSGGIILLAIVTGGLVMNLFYDQLTVGRYMKCKRFCRDFAECRRKRREYCYGIWERKK